MTENNNKHRIYDKDDQNPKDKQNNAKKREDQELSWNTQMLTTYDANESHERYRNDSLTAKCWMMTAMKFATNTIYNLKWMAVRTACTHDRWSWIFEGKKNCRMPKKGHRQITQYLIPKYFSKSLKSSRSMHLQAFDKIESFRC